MPESNGLPLGRHREVGLELARIRDRLGAITAEMAGAWPRRMKVHELAVAVTGPLDALRTELDARVRVDHPDAAADLYYPPEDVRDDGSGRPATRGPGKPGAVTGPEYKWNLRELMALRGMYKTSDLIKPLAARGITRNRTQIYRIVTKKPKQADIAVLLALCDILGCHLTDLAVPIRLDGTPQSECPQRERRAALP